MPVSYASPGAVIAAGTTAPVRAFAARTRAALPYWLRPTMLLIFTLGLPAVIAMQLADQTYIVEWGSPKFFRDEDAHNIGLAVLCFALGATLVATGRALTRRLTLHTTPMPEAVGRLDVLRPAFYVTAGLTLFGTLVWTALSMAQGINFGDVMQALSGNAEAVSRIRLRATTLPGITTLTQAGIALAAMAGLLWYRPASGTVRTVFLVVLLLTLIRSIVRAERLALIEQVIPFCVALLPSWLERYGDRPWVRIGLPLAPVAAVLGLFAFFMLAEAGRSYESKVNDGLQRNLVEYSAVRIGGYYSTSLNNGAYLSRQLTEGPWPYFALEWFWRFPGVDSRVNVQGLTGMGDDDMLQLLDVDLNPEFNNPSGFFSYRYDFGMQGIVLFFFGLGVVAGCLHGSYTAGRCGGRLLYPVFVIGLLEIARVPYFTSTRVFPAWMILFAVVAINAFVAWRQAPIERGTR